MLYITLFKYIYIFMETVIRVVRLNCFREFMYGNIQSTLSLYIYTPWLLYNFSLFIKRTCKTGTLKYLPSKFLYTCLGGGNSGNLTNPSIADHQFTIFRLDPYPGLALAWL